MSEAFWVAFISALTTGAAAVICQLIVQRNAAKELYAKLDKQSEMTDARIEAKLDTHQAVTDTKIDELTREVREHNNFARRIPVLEEKVKNLERSVSHAQQ